MRERVPVLTEDRYLHADMVSAIELVAAERSLARQVLSQCPDFHGPVMAAWLEVQRGAAPLIVSLSAHRHGDSRASLKPRLVSPWLARKDADWWVHLLYDIAPEPGCYHGPYRDLAHRHRRESGPPAHRCIPATATTDLCPMTTFDGEALYRAVCPPDPAEIRRRRSSHFDPYHAALPNEVDRLAASARARCIVYDAHSIRSACQDLFAGQLPQFNIGTYAAPAVMRQLRGAVEAVCARTPR